MNAFLGKKQPETPRLPDPFEVHLMEQAKLRQHLLRDPSDLPDWFWDEIDVTLLEREWSLRELRAACSALGLRRDGLHRDLVPRVRDHIMGDRERVREVQLRLEAEQDLAAEARGSVYAFGSNFAGQLGAGTRYATSEPTLMLPLQGEACTSVSAGFDSDFAFAVAASGECYTWGGGGDAFLGIDHEVAMRREGVTNPAVAQWFLSPFPIGALRGEGVVAVSAGPMHAAAVTDGGDVFVWGDASHGRLGVGIQVEGIHGVREGVTARAVRIVGKDGEESDEEEEEERGAEEGGGTGRASIPGPPTELALAQPSPASRTGRSRRGRSGGHLVRARGGPDPLAQWDTPARPSVQVTHRVRPAKDTQQAFYEWDSAHAQRQRLLNNKSDQVMARMTREVRRKGGKRSTRAATPRGGDGEEARPEQHEETGAPVLEGARESLARAKELGIDTAVGVREQPLLLRHPFLPEDEVAIQVCCGPTHTAVVTERGALYTCGLNNCGQLGHGAPEEEDRARYAVDDILAEESEGGGALVEAEAEEEEEEPLPPGPSRTGATVVGASRGGARSGTRRSGSGARSRPGTDRSGGGGEVDPTESVGTAGDAPGSASGGAQRPHTVLSPRAVQSLARLHVLQVACGSVHMLALTDHGVFSWGAGDGGRLGHGSHRSYSTPERVESLAKETVLQVACGAWHSAAVVLTPPAVGAGLLFTWGSGTQGQLGQGPHTTLLRPSPMDSLRKLGVLITYVSCGTYHCAAITSEGEVVTWGSNVEGCLGRPASVGSEEVPFSAEPGFVEGMGSVGRGPVCSVACGREFTVLATLPYEGPDAAEMRKLKQTEDVKRLAAERAEKQAKREAEAEAARREEERLALIKDLNRGHLLCTADDKCPGFFPDEISPFTCAVCHHKKTDHIIHRRPDDPDMTLERLHRQRQRLNPMGDW